MSGSASAPERRPRRQADAPDGRGGGPPDARALAGSRRAAMRRRARLIRRSVAVLAVTLFALVFTVVYVQLASGHDPALAAAARRRAAATSDPVAGSTSSGSGSSESARASSGESTATGSGEAGGTNGSGSEEASPTGPSAVTTSQS